MTTSVYLVGLSHEHVPHTARFRECIECSQYCDSQYLNCIITSVTADHLRFQGYDPVSSVVVY